MANDSVILVEGQDDKHVITNLLFAHQLDTRFVIKDKDGIDNLTGSLLIELRASELKRIGIIVDADTALVERWTSLRSVLKKAGYTDLPNTPLVPGIVVRQGGRPTVGIWLMPNNCDDGMIEDFVALLVPPEDRLLPRAGAAVDAIPGEDRRFVEIHRAKAVIHTWLAWQSEPGVRMGAAVTRMYLEPQAPTALAFVAWLNQLLHE